MKCEQARELASDALDGALGAGNTDRFHAHLDGCLPCRTYYAEMKESLLLLEELPVLEVGEDFDRAVWARIREEERSDSFVDVLRERWEMLRLRFSLGTGTLRWAPVGVGAMVLAGLALVSSPPAPEAPVPMAGLRVSAAEPSGLDLEVAEAAPIEADEVTADIPDAVEAFLESPARDLRLAPDQKYRKAIYSYPIRRFPDQRFESDRQGLGTPVSTGGSMRGTPVSAQTAPGTTGAAVFAF